MKQAVMLSIRGRQCYQDQEAEELELLTEGTLERRDDGWEVAYQESDLTGMEGVTTVFQVQPGIITLTRSGKLSSRMVFREGVSCDSLYQLEFGALMITVSATRVDYEITEQGGTIDLEYGIEIEQSATGVITYHLDIRAR